LLVSSFFFFFFQAEDGIRDKLVTGVQTCALPILSFAPMASSPRTSTTFAPSTSLPPATRAAKRSYVRDMFSAIAPRYDFLNHLRSEERRVGKECRARWSTER